MNESVAQLALVGEEMEKEMEEMEEMGSTLSLKNKEEPGLPK